MYQNYNTGGKKCYKVVISVKVCKENIQCQNKD